MSKIVCVLYDDPVDGYPPTYARNSIPEIERYPGGQTVPTPHDIDFVPGHLLGSVSGELGLRPFLEKEGHTLVVTSDKEEPDSVLDRELPDADVVISQPFWPAYLTAERMARAPGSSWRSRQASDPTMSTSTRPWNTVSPSPRSPTATASASRSTR